MPLPSGLIRLISPETYSLYRETIWVEGGVGGPLTWVSLSINNKATLTEFFRIASYAAFYILTVQLLKKKELLKRTVVVVIVFASLLSFLGILQHILSNNKIFWFRELTQGGNPFGPYVNRNHYAGLIGMIFPLVLSIFLFYKPDFSYGTFRERIYQVFNQKMTNTHILLGFSAILIATSIFLGLSRGGIISLSLSMIFLGIMIISKGKKLKRGILIILIFILILYSVGWFGWEPIFERFERIRDAQGEISEMRTELWKDSINIIKDFPVTGTGFGSFVNIYPGYRTISSDKIADHAHNDYIELFTDSGVIGFLLFGWFLIAVFYRSYKVFINRREPYCIYLFIGSLAGMVSILIHSITDFNLHIGANGLYFFFFAGLVVSAANTRLRDGLNNTYLKRIKLPLAKPLAAVIVVLLFLSLTFNIGVLTGKFYFIFLKKTNFSEDISREKLLAMKDAAYRASFFDPLEAQYHFAIAHIERLLSHSKPALSHYKMSVRLNPVKGEYLQMLGLVMSEMNRYDAAERLLRAGIRFDISSAVRYRIYASWLLSRDKKESSIRNIKKAISLEPQKTKKYITLLVLYGLSDREIQDSLPEMVKPHLLFADYLFKTGRDDMAEDEYLNALDYIKNEKEISPSYFYKVYQYYMKKGMYDNALMVMKRAVEALPDNVSIRLTTAGAYEKAGITYRAVEEYRKALIIDPENNRARKRLDKIDKRQ